LGYRVKAINLSKFTTEEVDAIYGNAIVRSTYFARWDSRYEPVPPVTHKEELKQFIIKAFVEKRWHRSTQPGIQQVVQPQVVQPQYNITSHHQQPALIPSHQPVQIYRPDSNFENPAVKKNPETVFAVKTYESPAPFKPPYFDLSKPTGHSNLETPTSNSPTPNLLADWGYKSQSQMPNPSQLPIQRNSQEPKIEQYRQPEPVRQPDQGSSFPFIQQPQRPPPRPVPPVIETPTPISPLPSQPVITPQFPSAQSQQQFVSVL
jgi:hypothetical protein